MASDMGATDAIAGVRPKYLGAYEFK